jgi:hypothetical protein
MSEILLAQIRQHTFAGLHICASWGQLGGGIYNVSNFIGTDTPRHICRAAYLRQLGDKAAAHDERCWLAEDLGIPTAEKQYSVAKS